MFITDVTDYARQCHKKTIVKCDLEAIEKCLGTVERAYRDAMDNMDRNDGLFACYNCARHTKMAGRNNHNCKYKDLDDHWMDEIDTEEKSWCLGWVASDGWLNANYTVNVAVNTCDVGVLEAMRYVICPDLPIADHRKGVMKKLSICSKFWYEAVQKHLGLKFEKGGSHKKSRTVKFPEIREDLIINGILLDLFSKEMGVGAKASSYGTGTKLVTAQIASASSTMRAALADVLRADQINCHVSQSGIHLSGQYAAAFLDKMYLNCRANLILERKHSLYRQYRGELFRFWRGI